MNEYTHRKYNYELFALDTLVISFIGYMFLLFGYSWFIEELAKDGDILNGMLLLIIGTIIIGLVVRMNIRYTSMGVGLLFSVLQIIVYIPSSVFGAGIALLILGALSNTKPVYNLN